MSTPEIDPLIGQPIGNYVVKSLLGTGGMGAVYLAEHPAIGRRVAIKVLAAHLSTHARLSERFLSEARALALIEHPNVIEIYDFGTLPDGRLFYVMELLKGLELGKVMNERGRLQADQVLPYLEQICHGLQATHEKGIIHRDLKPENIFVLQREQMVIKLLDFGIAKLQQVGAGGVSLTQTGMVMGTPLYIAPEQASGEVQKIGPQTDLYSLGVIVYWMITGRPPFYDETPALLLAQHISKDVPAMGAVYPPTPDGVARVVERCLAKQPGDRHGSARELAEAFAAAVEVEAEEQAARDAEIPAPEMVQAPSASTGEPVIEITSSLEEPGGVTGPPQPPPEFPATEAPAGDPDRTAPQLSPGVGPTSTLPASADAAHTVPAAGGGPSHVGLTIPVPMASEADLGATTPVPADEATLLDSQPQTTGAGEAFTPPPFEPAKTVGPSSSQITAELPETRAAIASASAEMEAGAIQHTQAQTTMRAAAGEMKQRKGVTVQTWILLGGLATALVLAGVLVFSSDRRSTPAVTQPPAAAEPPPDQGVPDGAQAADRGPAADRAAPRKARPARKSKPRSRKTPAAPARGGKPSPKFPDPFEDPGTPQPPAAPAVKPRPAPKPAPAKKPRPKKPKKIGEGTMEF